MAIAVAEYVLSAESESEGDRGGRGEQLQFPGMDIYTFTFNITYQRDSLN